ncbi:MAG: hypothetical protein ACKPHU_34930, partial [Planctomycetaceae bacterium]
MNRKTGRPHMWMAVDSVRLVLLHLPVWLLLCLRCSEQAVGGQSLSQTRHFDVIVGSCSPTGVAAAVAASSRGCSVLLTDSAEVPASPHSQSPGITFLHQTRITAVYRSPDSR